MSQLPYSVIFDGMGAATPWQPGALVSQWEYKISPLDSETYQRVTASGSGATDPANDTTNYRARSYERVTALPNSATYMTQAAAGAANFGNGAVKVTPGAIAAGARTEILSLSGRGLLCFLGFMKGVANGGRLEVILDGRTVFDNSIQSATTDASVLIGSCSPGGASMAYPAYFALPEPGVKFLRTLSVWYTPTTTATTSSAVLAHIVRATA